MLNKKEFRHHFAEKKSNLYFKIKIKSNRESTRVTDLMIIVHHTSCWHSKWYLLVGIRWSGWYRIRIIIWIFKCISVGFIGAIDVTRAVVVAVRFRLLHLVGSVVGRIGSIFTGNNGWCFSFMQIARTQWPLSWSFTVDRASKGDKKKLFFNVKTC